MVSINYKKILSLKFNLAPSQLNILDIPNKNTILIRDLLDRELKSSDRGNEVGSLNYISESDYHFIRSKELQTNYFLSFLDNKSVVAIRPQVFKNFNLKAGDLIISKDSNIGEAIILDRDYPKFMISSALYRLPITNNKLYIFAFLKHNYFKKQLDLFVPKGSIIRHAKTFFLDCKIPFPSQKTSTEIIRYIELLTQAVINKEKEIRRKNQLIFDLIEKEILENQKDTKFKYESPRFSELFSNLRFDSGYYCFDYKQKIFLISNYKNRAKTIDDWGFEMKRGSSLAVCQIGKSIYLDNFKKKFYTLIRPTNFSEFGTVEKFEYFGNPKKLTLLNTGDVVFSAEGTIGKCILFDNPKEKWITNYHGMILSKKDYKIKESAFITCFLRFLRHWGMLEYISVGGQGGSLAKNYWKDILIPKFPKFKQEEIASLYHNPEEAYPTNLDLNDFLEKDQKWNEKAGIIEIDKSIKTIKEYLNKTLDKIINDEKVETDFSFLHKVFSN